MKRSSPQLELVLARLDQKFEDFQKHIDQRFEDMACVQGNCRTKFNDLYKKYNEMVPQIVKNSTMVLTGSGIIAILVSVIVNMVTQ